MPTTNQISGVNLMAKTVFTTASSSDKNQAAGFINLSGGISIPFKSEAFLEKFEALTPAQQKAVLIALIEQSSVNSVWIRSRDQDKPSTQEDFLMNLVNSL